MADVADQGSASLLGAREGALQAIAQAEADNFTVDEDLSVADNTYRKSPEEYAARLAQAQAHLAYIEHHAGLLEAESQRVATQLGAGAGQMEGMVPAAWQPGKGGPGAVGPDDTIIDDGDRTKPTIQAVDNHHGPLPADPPPPPPAPPQTGEPIRLPPRTTPAPPTVITAAPPDTPAQNHDPLPNCTVGDEAVIGGEAVGGGRDAGNRSVHATAYVGW